MLNTTYKGHTISRVKLKRYGEKGEPAILIQIKKPEGELYTIVKSIVLEEKSMHAVSRAMKDCYRYIDSIVE